jgi:hypothetical protein
MHLQGIRIIHFTGQNAELKDTLYQYVYWISSLFNRGILLPSAQGSITIYQYYNEKLREIDFLSKSKPVLFW